MEIRPAVLADLDGLDEIDGTIESSQYLHVERGGEGLALHWKLEERPLREKRIERNRPSHELHFDLKQILSGIEEGLALVAEHENAIVALMLGQPQPQYATMKLLDVRVDYDQRRQGLATAMIYQLISEARNRELRAVFAECTTDNLPACRLLSKLGFDLAGLDTQRYTNHDLVKESATLLWYAALD